jgi:hypothetical protein
MVAQWLANRTRNHKVACPRPYTLTFNFFTTEVDSLENSYYVIGIWFQIRI